MDWSWLLLLMCPLMMLPMMFFMMKGNHGDSSKHDHSQNLTDELKELRAQNETMQKELIDLKSKV